MSKDPKDCYPPEGNWIQFCCLCGMPFKTTLEADMAPNGPDGNPVHYSCKAELTIMEQQP